MKKKPETTPDGYEQVYAGVPFEEPAGRYWQLACCHCGLVHEVKIEPQEDGTLRITMKENSAATKRHRAVSAQHDLLVAKVTPKPKRKKQ